MELRSAFWVDEWKQCHNARTFHGVGEITLLLCGETGQTTGKNLASFRDELLEKIHILVIDGISRFDRRKALLEKGAGHVLQN